MIMDPEEALLKEIFREEKIPEKIPFVRYIINTINDIPRQLRILRERLGISR